MTLGPHVPEWQALRRALDSLVAECEGAILAAVLCESNVLWCWSRPTAHLRDRWSEVVCRTDVFHAGEVASLRLPLRRGGRLSVARRRERLRLVPTAGSAPSWLVYAAESFASVYVLVVWFTDLTDPTAHTPALRAALPRIEALMVALPPPDGPGSGSGAALVR